MATPLFAYSDVDTIEIELMANELQEKEYKKGDFVAKMGRMVVPALYFVRSGAIVSV